MEERHQHNRGVSLPKPGEQLRNPKGGPPRTTHGINPPSGKRDIKMDESKEDKATGSSGLDASMMKALKLFAKNHHELEKVSDPDKSRRVLSYDGRRVSTTGNIPASTYEKCGGTVPCGPKFVNDLVEKELANYKHEVEAKFMQSHMNNNYVFERRKVLVKATPAAVSKQTRKDILKQIAIAAGVGAPHTPQISAQFKLTPNANQNQQPVILTTMTSNNGNHKQATQFIKAAPAGKVVSTPGSCFNDQQKGAHAIQQQLLQMIAIAPPKGSVTLDGRTAISKKNTSHHHHENGDLQVKTNVAATFQREQIDKQQFKNSDQGKRTLSKSPPHNSMKVSAVGSNAVQDTQKNKANSTAYGKKGIELDYPTDNNLITDNNHASNINLNERGKQGSHSTISELLLDEEGVNDGHKQTNKQELIGKDANIRQVANQKSQFSPKQDIVNQAQELIKPNINQGKTTAVQSPPTTQGLKGYRGSTGIPYLGENLINALPSKQVVINNNKNFIQNTASQKVKPPTKQVPKTFDDLQQHNTINPNQPPQNTAFKSLIANQVTNSIGQEQPPKSSSSGHNNRNSSGNHHSGNQQAPPPNYNYNQPQPASIVINKPIVIQFQNKKITFKNHYHHHHHHHHHGTIDMQNSNQMEGANPTNEQKTYQSQTHSSSGNRASKQKISKSNPCTKKPSPNQMSPRLQGLQNATISLQSSGPSKNLSSLNANQSIFEINNNSFINQQAIMVGQAGKAPNIIQSKNPLQDQHLIGASIQQNKQIVTSHQEAVISKKSEVVGSAANQIIKKSGQSSAVNPSKGKKNQVNQILQQILSFEPQHHPHPLTKPPSPRNIEFSTQQVQQRDESSLGRKLGTNTTSNQGNSNSLKRPRQSGNPVIGRDAGNLPLNQIKISTISANFGISKTQDSRKAPSNNSKEGGYLISGIKNPDFNILDQFKDHCNSNENVLMQGGAEERVDQHNANMVANTSSFSSNFRTQIPTGTKLIIGNQKQVVNLKHPKTLQAAAMGVTQNEQRKKHVRYPTYTGVGSPCGSGLNQSLTLDSSTAPQNHLRSFVGVQIDVSKDQGSSLKRPKLSSSGLSSKQMIEQIMQAQTQQSQHQRTLSSKAMEKKPSQHLNTQQTSNAKPLKKKKKSISTTQQSMRNSIQSRGIQTHAKKSPPIKVQDSLQQSFNMQNYHLGDITKTEGIYQKQQAQVIPQTTNSNSHHDPQTLYLSRPIQEHHYIQIHQHFDQTAEKQPSYYSPSKSSCPNAESLPIGLQIDKGSGQQPSFAQAGDTHFVKEEQNISHFNKQQHAQSKAKESYIENKGHQFAENKTKQSAQQVQNPAEQTTTLSISRRK